jgi:hypothetical protein
VGLNVPPTTAELAATIGPVSQLEFVMRPLDSLSTATLRRKARGRQLLVRYHRNWNGVVGNDGYVVIDVRFITAQTDPLGERELRDYLIDALNE